MQASEALDPLLGRELGRYRLVHNLRHGGMGVVYLARHTLLGKAFAVKVLRVESADDRSMIERFKREAQALAGLTHPNTVTVTDFGATPDGLLFLVMEFLQGVTCADLLVNGGPLPPERVVHLATQVCDALHEAHLQNIIHRDIKPNNLLVTRVADRHDVIKVIDFGLAKQTAADDGPLAEVTRAGLLIGTPQYMPPEQIKGTDMDGRGDVYSLGVTLFRLLTGRYPLEHKDVAALFHMHLSETPPAPSEHIADGAMIDLDLDDVLLKCLEKNPADRYQDMLELKDDLLRCASAGAWGAEEAEVAFEASRKYADVVDVDLLLARDAPGRDVDQDAPTQITVSPFETRGAGLPSPAGMPLPGPTPLPGTVTPSSWPKGEIVGAPHSGPHSQPIALWSWERVAVALVLVLLVAFVGASAAVWLARETRPATPTITVAPAPTPVPAPAPAVAPTPGPPPVSTPPTARLNEVVTVFISSNPSGASVSEGDQALGSSPLTVTRPRDDGEITLSIELVGYRKATRTIDLRIIQGDRHDLIVNLARIPPRARRRASGAKTKTRRATRWSPKKRKSTGADRPRPAPSGGPRFKTVD